MRDLIASLEEAAGPERLTARPRPCPFGWTQVKVRQGRRVMYTCKPPSERELAMRGANPLVLAWEAVKKYDIARAERSLNIGRYTPKQNKIRFDILTILEQEQEDDLRQGKTWLIKTLKPMFKSLGVDVSPASRRRKRSR